MDWAEDNGTDYIFGLAGNAALDAVVAEIADNLRFQQARLRENTSKNALSLGAC
jgi:hypothetical protein